MSNRAGEFIEYTGCPTGPSARNCAIKMDDLAKEFDLRAGDTTIVRVTARNMHGSGKPCTHTNTVVMKTRPNQMPAPQAVAEGMKKISVSWPAACSGRDCSYEIRIKSPGQLPITKRLQTASYELLLPGTCTTYSFEVRAWNGCGCSAWSLATTVKIGELPNPPTVVTTAAQLCSVDLAWEPSTTTCPIQKYVLEIQDGNGSWQVLSACGGDLDNRKCSLHRFTLTNQYQLRVGSNVVVRARAQNCCGWSQWSQET